MNVDSITQLISSVGFPIVMVGIMCWYIYWTTGKLSKTMNVIQQDLALIMEKLGLYSKENETKEEK